MEKQYFFWCSLPPSHPSTFGTRGKEYSAKGDMRRGLRAEKVPRAACQQLDPQLVSQTYVTLFILFCSH